ncbi:hypothetical protein [Mycolicibacterium diernhoferi]|nr:hypothetical protein [Mycolicibacterium diernhoferi]
MTQPAETDDVADRSECGGLEVHPAIRETAAVRDVGPPQVRTGAACCLIGGGAPLACEHREGYGTGLAQVRTAALSPSSPNSALQWVHAYGSCSAAVWFSTTPSTTIVTIDLLDTPGNTCYR